MNLILNDAHIPAQTHIPSCCTTSGGKTLDANALLKMALNSLSRPPMPILLKFQSGLMIVCCEAFLNGQNAILLNYFEGEFLWLGRYFPLKQWKMIFKCAQRLAIQLQTWTCMLLWTRNINYRTWIKTVRPPEVNLRKHESEGMNVGFETQRRQHQKSKTGVSVVPQKGLMVSKFVSYHSCWPSRAGCVVSNVNLRTKQVTEVHKRGIRLGF